MLIKFFHRLMNPHCPDCQMDELESGMCKSCEILQQQLAIVNEEKRILLDRLTLKLPEPISAPMEEIEQPLITGRKKHVPFAVRQQHIEDGANRTLELLQKKHAEMKLGRTEIKIENAPDTTDKEIELLEQNVLKGAN